MTEAATTAAGRVSGVGVCAKADDREAVKASVALLGPLLVAKSGVVKILDFGLAKLAGTEGVTQTGTSVGTVALGDAVWS